MNDIVIRENIDEYMKDLKDWIESIKDTKLEFMGDFFAARINGYEDHMSLWKDAYIRFAELIPIDSKKILDLGCGTGLELEHIFNRLPKVDITGIDLCTAMLEKLQQKFSDKSMNLICDDYFSVKLSENTYDTVISFESLHHFTMKRKQQLFEKIYNSLKDDGIYIECDYIACCEEEEELLFKVCKEKRKKININEDVFIHFDTPLTLEHEIALMKQAGFSKVDVIDSINGATIIMAEKSRRNAR